MLVYHTHIIQYCTSRYIRQFNETFVMSDFIKRYKTYTCIKSWDIYCTVTLCEAVIICYIVKTTLTSVTFLKPNCSHMLMIVNY